MWNGLNSERVLEQNSHGKGNTGMRYSWRKGYSCAWLGWVLFFFLAWPAWGEEQFLPQPGNPLSLEQCLAIALKYHPTLRVSLATVEASKARIEQALANYYPQVNFNTAYSSSTYNVFGAGPFLVGKTYNWTFYDFFTVGPTLTQTIYDFGRTPNTVKINRENTKANEQDFITTKQTIVLNVKQAYFVLIQFHRLVKVAEDTVRQIQEHLNQARAFLRAGTVPEIDVTQAEVDLANAELAQIRARNGVQVAQITLNNAMGLRQDLSFPIEDTLEFKKSEITLQEILQAAYEQRPEILQLKARQLSQEATVKVAQASYYPLLSGNASYLYRGIHVNDLYWDMTIGATLTVPIFSGFSSPNQVAEARAILKNLQAQEETTRQNIRLEAEQAYLSLKEAEESVRVSGKALAQAEKKYGLATGRYRVGVGSPLEVTDAEVSLANARVNSIQSLAGYKIAEARIEKAMGSVR
jgi:outer membrane protein